MTPDQPSVRERYQHKPFIGSSHMWAMAKLERFSAEAKILDVGPGSGLMGKHLKERGLQDLHAVEIDPEARAQVAEYYQKVEAEITPFLESKFDGILLLDVLEHMTDPIPFFGQCVKLLKPGGRILISVPNVAHWSVRIPLIFGAFNYTDRGILDRTHYQFFTRKRFLHMIRQEKLLQIGEINSSIEPAEFVLPEIIWNNPAFDLFSKFRQGVAKEIPGIFAYQHLAEVIRRTSASASS